MARSEEGAEVWGPPSAMALSDLFTELHPFFTDAHTDAEKRLSVASDSTPSFGRLPAMLDALRDLTFGQPGPQMPQVLIRADDPDALDHLLKDLKAPLEAVWASGLFGNPWTAAALRRDEVRNASVLAWFLDPRGGHGCGAALLVFLLKRIRQCIPGFPERPSARCVISVEECPDGLRSDRVDIQIADADFIIIIEVKIGASEQPDQLQRYCRIAERRSNGKPWAIVFLTRKGKPPVTGGEYGAWVVPLAWSAVASALRSAVPSGGANTAAPRFLATTFADHIINL